MKSRPVNARTSHLKKRGHRWYVVVAIPRKLQETAGRTEFVKALGTGDLDEANKRKHAWVAEFKRRIEELRSTRYDADLKDLMKARDYREALDSPEEISADDQDEDGGSAHDEVLSLMLEDAKEIARTKGTQAARRFHAVAIGKATLIKDLWARWLSEVECIEQTKDQHKYAIGQYLAWAGEYATVEECDRAKAGAYVSKLLSEDHAKKTLLRYLSSLSSFWQWLRQRGITDKDNPWRGHGIKTKRQAAQRHALSEEQLKRLLRLPWTPRWHRPIHTLVRLALLTGARIEALCLIKGKDVTKREDGYWVTIQARKKETTSREVPVHAVGVPLIEGLLSHQGADEYLVDGLTAGRFGNRSEGASRAYYLFKRAAGVGEKGYDFHALRSTFISMMEGAEVPESTVKLLVGHKRPSITFGLYSKGAHVDLRAAIDKLQFSDEVAVLMGAIPPRLDH